MPSPLARPERTLQLHGGEMNGPVKILLVLGLFLAIGYVMYDHVASAQTSCEVCLDIRGEIVCRRGIGATEAEALRAAQESSCGGNTRNMSEAILCLNATPVSTRCDAQ
jgi:hypothetical protein